MHSTIERLLEACSKSKLACLSDVTNRAKSLSPGPVVFQITTSDSSKLRSGSIPSRFDAESLRLTLRKAHYPDRTAWSYKATLPRLRDLAIGKPTQRRWLTKHITLEGDAHVLPSSTYSKIPDLKWDTTRGIRQCLQSLPEDVAAEADLGELARKIAATVANQPQIFSGCFPNAKLTLTLDSSATSGNKS